jgi:hypothetical protein
LKTAFRSLLAARGTDLSFGRRLIRELLISAGLATDEEIERHLSNVASGRLHLATSPMVSAWGPQAGVTGRPWRPFSGDAIQAATTTTLTQSGPEKRKHV